MEPTEEFVLTLFDPETFEKVNYLKNREKRPGYTNALALEKIRNKL